MNDFRKNLLLWFKLTKDELTLMAEAFNLNQKFNENVSSYAIRARVIREKLDRTIDLKHNIIELKNLNFGCTKNWRLLM